MTGTFKRPKELGPRCLRAILLRFLAAVALATTSTTSAALPDGVQEPPFPLPTFNEETLAIFSKIPVQDGGRVKPMSTFARYALMPLSGRTSLTVGVTPDGKLKTLLKGKRGFEGQTHRYSASEWLLLCLLHPEEARRIPTFIVNDSDTLLRFGGEPKRKRDIYSYADLASHLDSLVTETGKSMGLEDRERDRIDDMVIALGQNVLAFQRLTAFLDFARNGIALGTAEVPEFFPTDAEGNLSVSAFLATLPQLRENPTDTSSEYLRKATLHARALPRPDRSCFHNPRTR